MANTKNAQLRYRILDKCFRRYNSPCTFKELKEEIERVFRDLFDDHYKMPERTLREDIKNMKERTTFNAPIVCRQMIDGSYCYFYSDRNYSIFKSNISEKDYNILQSTIDMLGRYRGLPSTAWLEEVITNLEYRFDLKVNRKTLVSFEQNSELKGLEHLSSLIDAATKQQALDITYCSYRGKERAYTLSPYYIKQYNGRWFLFGLDNTTNRLMNLALDRIVSFKQSSETYLPNTDFDFDTYFNDIIGVTVPEADVKLETIKLRFTEDRYPYVVSKPIHPSQKVVDPVEHIVSISVKPNRELYQRLFSFIPDVEVLSPEWLRKEIIERLKMTLDKHF